MRHSIRWATLIAVLALAVGAVVGALALPSLAPPSATSTAETRVVPAVERSFDDAHTMNTTPIVAEQVTVLSSGGSGVVTSSSCTVGAEVKTGDTLLSVNGAVRVAVVTTVPLWRDLIPQTKGVDVQALQAALVAKGYGGGSSGTYDRATVAAVKQLQKAAAVAQSGNVALDQIQWIPAGSGTVSSCAAPVGSMISAGQPLLTVGGQLVALVLPDSSTELPGRAYVAVAGDVVVPVPDDRRLTDPKMLEIVASSTGFTAWTLDPSAGVSVDIRVADAIESFGVPPSAVVLADSGHGCIVAADKTVVPVEILSSELGTVFVVADQPVTNVVVPAKRAISHCE